MRVFFIGDIVGQAGVKKLSKHLPEMKKKYGIHFCVANGENAAGGLGITPLLAKEIFSAGVDAITLGNHTFSKYDIYSFLEKESKILRPWNLGDHVYGRGFQIFQVQQEKILLVNLQGQVFMQTPSSPFHYIDKIDKIKKEHGIKIVLVDFHAEATSEKIALAHALDGKISALVGTHTHIQTADERILPLGTAYLTDLGMTGPWHSVLGMDVEVALQRFQKHLPARYEISKEAACLSGFFVDISLLDGRAVQVARYLDRPDYKADILWVKK